ncbi:hypothetical protein E3A20_19260 [Planctomyces bekefii]|uniref:VIT domain-containing protein n=1 Tax=Planctomyces bekefii TaxID=1653850 RepID=A0A5C6M487_9PLAN|nr:hypothetical protein E3A20_19260 [Planctomyces bekefii]
MAGDTWGRLAADGKLSPDLRSLRVEDTTYVNHAGIRVQVFPDQYVAYTEVDLQIESSSARESVANMLFEIPSGSVASSLTLWIDGQERPARFALRGKASQAFNTIVNKKRDPALIEWIDDRHLRLQVFPVSHVLPRRVKVGYVTPLDSQELELEYRSPTISGIRQDTASAFVTVEVFSDQQPQALTSNLDFKPLGVTAGAAKPFEAQTSLTKPWSVKFAARGEKPIHEPSTWSPESIVFVPRGGRPEARWNDAKKALQSAFPNATIGAFGDRLNWLTSSKDLTRSVEDGRTMRGLPLPFYQREMPNPSTTLYVVENDRAPNILTLRGTDYFRSMSNFFVNHGEGLRILGLDDAMSPFYSGLSELDLATVLSFDGKRLLQVPSLISSVRGEKMATEFVDRLVAYKQSMRHAILDEVRGDGTPDSLTEEMRKGHLVTPFSSLIVLETEGDYSRFGINDKDSEKNNTRPADPSLRESLGLVPEPHEYLLLAICLAAIAYMYRRRSGAVLG